MINFAKTGLDQVSGSSDDFDFSLRFVGQTSSADILIEFDSSQTGGFPAAANLSITRTSDHTRVNSAEIFFDETLTWFFNQVLENEEVFADFSHSGVEDGTQTFPFNSMAEAMDLVAIGGTVRLTTSSTSETIRINQTVTLKAPIGSLVRIGDLNAPAPSPILPAPRTGFVAGPPNR